MDIIDFVTNLPDRIWCFMDDELRWYRLDQTTEGDIYFKNSDGQTMEDFDSIESLIETCGDIYLSVEDFKNDKPLVLDF